MNYIYTISYDTTFSFIFISYLILLPLYPIIPQVRALNFSCFVLWPHLRCEDEQSTGLDFRQVWGDIWGKGPKFEILDPKGPKGLSNVRWGQHPQNCFFWCIPRHPGEYLLRFGVWMVGTNSVFGCLGYSFCFNFSIIHFHEDEMFFFVHILMGG